MAQDQISGRELLRRTDAEPADRHSLLKDHRKPARAGDEVCATRKERRWHLDESLLGELVALLRRQELHQKRFRALFGLDMLARHLLRIRRPWWDWWDWR